MSADLVAPVMDQATRMLVACGLVDADFPSYDPQACEGSVLSIEKGFEVPETTISPLLRRFLLHMAFGTRPQSLFGAGTYVGFAFAFLIAGRALRGGDFQAVGVDVDATSTSIATRNAALLGIRGQVHFRTADAVSFLENGAGDIDLLFIDVDDPVTRKAGYTDILNAAMPRLAAGATILAHDPLVDLFAADFQAYNARIAEIPRLRGPLSLPLDECGLSIARVVP